MLPLFLFLIACGTPQPEKLESEPAAPTVELGGSQPQSEITWATLKGLLPDGEPGLPAVLGVHLGQEEAAARTAFDAALHTKLAQPADQTLDGVTVHAGRLQAFPEVGANLMFEGGVLVGVDLSLPREEALFATDQVWGEPDDNEVAEQGVPRPVWVHEGLRAVLIDVEGDSDVAILKYSKTE